MEKDPLVRATKPAAHDLMTRFSREAHGFPTEDVFNAAANLIINSLRQAHADRASAERAFDELFGRSKTVLVDHYDSLGRKRGVFPFDQVIHMPLKDLRNGPVI